MLDELSVVNLGIIPAARLEPGPGMIVVTGETGTGKTLLLGALQLLLGMPARSGLVGPDADEAVIEGRFLTDDGEVVVARRVAKQGRSRSYLNGSMAPLTAIAEATSGFVEVVAQNDQLTITRPPEVRRLVDRALDASGRKTAAAYAELWSEHESLLALRAELGGDNRALERERALAEWQAKEIGDAGFGDGDDEDLERLLQRLRGGAQLGDLLGDARTALDNAVESVGEARAALTKALRIDDTLSGVNESLTGAIELVGDVARDVRAAAETTDTDPVHLDEAERRMAVLGDLRRKYGATLDEVLRFGEQAAKRAEELGQLAEKAETLDAKELALNEQLVTSGQALMKARQAAGDRLATAAIEHLCDLGFADPTVRVVIESRQPHRGGADQVQLEFASDSRLEPGPVAKVASGGELSRLVLALRLAGGAGTAPVVAFDEIDAGVGGKTGLALGKKMAELARSQQVLAVTHLPQIAAFADTHIVVERDGTTAVARRLTADERTGELSRMLAGLDESSRGHEHAAELLKTATELRRL